MVKILLSVFLLIPTFWAFSQEEENKIFFSEAIAMHLPKYEIKAKEAYRQRNFDEAQRLYDSLVDYGLAGTYMNNFKFNNLKTDRIPLYSFKKPVYLITYASWCIQSKGELPALNKLAEDYKNQIDFVVVFWDDKPTTTKEAKKYSDHITILFINEQKNKDAFVISNLKHSLGLPTVFLLDKDKKVLDVRRGVTHPYGESMENSYEMNYNKIHKGIVDLLEGKISGPVAVN